MLSDKDSQFLATSTLEFMRKVQAQVQPQGTLNSDESAAKWETICQLSLAYMSMIAQNPEHKKITKTTLVEDE